MLLEVPHRLPMMVPCGSWWMIDGEAAESRGMTVGDWISEAIVAYTKSDRARAAQPPGLAQQAVRQEGENMKHKLPSFAAVALTIWATSHNAAAELSSVNMALFEQMADTCGELTEIGKAVGAKNSTLAEVRLLRNAESYGANEFQLKLLRLKWLSSSLRGTKTSLTFKEDTPEKLRIEIDNLIGECTLGEAPK